MPPPGFLLLRDACTFFRHNPQRDYMATRKLLARHGIQPAAQLTTGHRPLLWRFADLEPLRHRAPSASYDDEWEAA
jgi:hypothetical protein